MQNEKIAKWLLIFFGVVGIMSITSLSIEEYYIHEETLTAMQCGYEKVSGVASGMFIKITAKINKKDKNTNDKKTKKTK